MATPHHRPKLLAQHVHLLDHTEIHPQSRHMRGCSVKHQAFCQTSLQNRRPSANTNTRFATKNAKPSLSYPMQAYDLLLLVLYEWCPLSQLINYMVQLKAGLCQKTDRLLSQSETSLLGTFSSPLLSAALQTCSSESREQQAPSARSLRLHFKRTQDKANSRPPSFTFQTF